MAAAERFLACARSTDTVARLGGDEFAILVEEVMGAEGPSILMDRLTEAMQAPFHLGGNEVHVSASFGIATALGDETADDLLRNADLAMYTAKREGKGRFATYESRMVADSRQRLEMEAALRGAIERERAGAPLPADHAPPDRRRLRVRGAGALEPPAVRPPAARSTSSRWRRRRGRSCGWAAGCCARRAPSCSAGGRRTPTPNSP